VLPDTNKQYPVTIERVKKIKSLNQQGIIPGELEAVEVTSNKPKEAEPEFVDVVGQISLRSLEKNDKRRTQQQQAQKNKDREQQRPQQKQQTNQQKGQQHPQQQRPNQQRPPFKKGK
jgi:hypothetical protein